MTGLEVHDGALGDEAEVAGAGVELVLAHEAQGDQTLLEDSIFPLLSAFAGIAG
nr:hypothetical protein [Hyalangium gracile]